MTKEGRSAEVRMEEEYMSVTIDYTNKEDRTIICDKIAKLEEEFDVHPEVIHKRSQENSGGSYTVEFSKDVYTHSRIPGDFIEALLHRINIKHCEED